MNAENTPITRPVPKIDSSKGTRYAISDIHGCVQTFKALITKINLTTDDQLFLLGDYINKGPDSKGVLDYIIELQKTFSVFCLRGNHEELLMRAHRRAGGDKSIRLIPILHRGRGLVDENRRILPIYLPFLENLCYYFELDDYYLVHAGFDFEAPNPFFETEKMLWVRHFDVDTSIVGEKRIIHGHVPEYLQFIQEEIDYGCPTICIDNGCVYKARRKAGLGQLLALNLDTLEIILQENIETERSSSRSHFL